RNSSANLLRLVDLPAVTERFAGLESFEGQIQALAFSRDGAQLAIALRERLAHKVLLVDPATGATRTTVEEFAHERTPLGDRDEAITRLVFSPDGKILAAYGQYEPGNYRVTWWHLADAQAQTLNLPRGTTLWNDQLDFVGGGRMLAALVKSHGIEAF